MGFSPIAALQGLELAARFGHICPYKCDVIFSIKFFTMFPIMLSAHRNNVVVSM